jgi:2-iminobutanoate/2-iminopropanoate deaminase
MRTRFIDPDEFQCSAVEIPFDGTKRIIFVSGQLPINPETGNVIPYPGGKFKGTAKHQTERCILNLQIVLKKEGLSLSNVIKTTVFIDADEYAEILPVMNEVYANFFPEGGSEGSYIRKPARSVVCSKIPMEGVFIMIEAIAFHA